MTQQAAIVCTNCGERNAEDAAFCGACGTFLEWEGAPADSEPTVPIATTTAQPVAVEEAEPEGGLRKPGEAERRRRSRPQTAPRPVAPGELACAGCGSGNDPARRFCRSCGLPLHAAPTVERPGFWRRLRDRWRQRTRYEAGFRRRIRLPVRVPRSMIVLAIATVLALIGVGPGHSSIAKAQTEIRDRISSKVPVTPKAWRASSSRAGNPPDRLGDRAANKFWAPTGAPAGAWVEADLPRPVRLLYLVITGGQSSDAIEFQKQGRPYQVVATLTSEGGRTTSTVLTLRDQAGPQRVTVKGDRVTRVRLTFRSAHGMAAGRFMAVGELEFFVRG